MRFVFGTFFRSSMVHWMLAGVLLGLSFFSPWLWYLGFFGIFFFIKASLCATTWRNVVFGSFMAGVFQMALVLSWYWAVFPLNWAGVENEYLAMGVVFYSWACSFVPLAAAKVPVALLLRFFSLKNKALALIAFPFVWVFCEVLGSLLFSIFTIGPGAYVNFEYSFGYLGYLFAEHQLLLSLSFFGGVYVLSFIYAGFAALQYGLFMSTYGRRVFLMAGAIALLLFSINMPLVSKTYDEHIRVVALETTFPHIMTPAMRDEGYAKLIEQMKTVLEAGYEYIVLPEGSDFRSRFSTDDEVFTFLDEHRITDVVLVDSALASDVDDASYLRAYIYDTKTHTVIHTDKQYFVPAGEFLPNVIFFLMWVLGKEDIADEFAKRFNFKPGPNNPLQDQLSYIPGVLFCSESVSPFRLKRLSASRDMPFVAHLVSHAWFHEPHVLWHELDQMMKVNSRFANVTVIQASNMYTSLRY